MKDSEQSSKKIEESVQSANSSKNGISLQKQEIESIDSLQIVKNAETSRKWNTEKKHNMQDKKKKSKRMRSDLFSR